MNEDEVAQYSAKVDEVVAIVSDLLRATQTYPSARELAHELVPGRIENIRVLNAVRGAKLPHITLGDYKRAMYRLQAEWDRAAKKLAQEDRIRQRQGNIFDLLGGMPTDERTFVALFLTKQDYHMGYDRAWTRGTEKITLDDVRNDIHLTASTLGLTRQTRDQPSLVTNSNLDRALDEWQSIQRIARRDAIIDSIMQAPADYGATMASYHRLCRAMFPDPTFAGACVADFVWQIKRKLLNLPIEQHHCLVLVGPQQSAKTWFGRKLQSPIEELAAEACLPDVLDPRQMDLPQFYALFLDEFAFADRAEAAALKSLITGDGVARRPMASNKAQKVPINAILHGNTNRGLGALIFDASGMRRFTETQVKPRKDIEPYWEADVAPFQWIELWRCVDAFAESPLVPFADKLAQVQEALRNPDNTEQWLQGFEYKKGVHACKWETSSREQVEFFAQDLYSIFRDWEKTYDPGFKGTSINRWGRELKALIHSGMAPDWSVRVAGNKTVYRQQLHPAQESNAVVLMRKPK